ILEAFAHFTYQYTEGYLVVYGLQGFDLNNEFLLTDPVIYCVDLLRFGTTNLGKSGIQKCFLEKHKCNDICKKLKLSNDIWEGYCYENGIGVEKDIKKAFEHYQKSADIGHID